MSKRKYREAAMAKRQDLSRAVGRGYILPEFTQEELLAADKAYDAAKTSPQAWDQRIHAMHQDEVRMLRILGSAL
jgi:hypothetical protein